MDNTELKEIKELILITSMSCVGITSIWNMANYANNENIRNETKKHLYFSKFGIIKIPEFPTIFINMAMFSTVVTTACLMIKMWQLN